MGKRKNFRKAILCRHSPLLLYKVSFILLRLASEEEKRCKPIRDVSVDVIRGTPGSGRKPLPYYQAAITTVCRIRWPNRSVTTPRCADSRSVFRSTKPDSFV